LLALFHQVAIFSTFMRKSRTRWMGLLMIISAMLLIRLIVRPSAKAAKKGNFGGIVLNNKRTPRLAGAFFYLK